MHVLRSEGNFGVDQNVSKLKHEIEEKKELICIWNPMFFSLSLKAAKEYKGLSMSIESTKILFLKLQHFKPTLQHDGQGTGFELQWLRYKYFLWHIQAEKPWSKSFKGLKCKHVTWLGMWSFFLFSLSSKFSVLSTY